jgi:hypothetical protein
MSFSENPISLADLDSPELLNFQKNGYHFFRRDQYKWSSSFFEKISQISQNSTLFEIKSKNNGAKTLQNEVLESHETDFIIDYLFDSGLLQACMEVAGRPLFLTNYVLIECGGNTKSLPWHRDSYHYKNSNRVGLIPYCYKLLISNNNLDCYSPGTEILKGSHNIDFNSRLFDFIWKSSGIGKVRFEGLSGDAVLFNGHCLHRRPKTSLGKKRSALIFGLSPVQWHQNHYIKNHSNVIKRYNERLTSLLGRL